jgi:hypothetical protein
MTVALLYLLGSLGCFWYSFNFIKLYIQVKKWTKTEASVIYKKIEERGKNSKARGYYEVKVDYTYLFNNKKYTGRTVYLSELVKNRVNQQKAVAEKIVNDLPDKIMAFVNPRQPEQSFLFVTGVGLYIIVAIAGLFCFGYGLTTLIALL